MDTDYHVIEKLIRNISHEIKNPLTTIKGYAQLLGMKSDDPEFAEKTRRMILTNVDQIDAKINALYGIFEIQQGDNDKNDVVKILRDFLKSGSGAARRNVELDLPSERCVLMLNAGHFARVLGLIIDGFDWDNNTGTVLTVSMRKEFSDKRIGLLFVFTGMDLSNAPANTFFLPYSDKKYFRTGTELFEVSIISRINGWGFTIFNGEEGQGFLLGI